MTIFLSILVLLPWFAVSYHIDRLRAGSLPVPIFWLFAQLLSALITAAAAWWIDNKAMIPVILVFMIYDMLFGRSLDLEKQRRASKTGVDNQSVVVK